MQLPTQFIIVFEPVTHSAQFIDVQGEPTRERQQLSLIYNRVQAPTGTTTMRPGPLRLALDNQTDVRVLVDDLYRRRWAASSAWQPQAVPDRQADAEQPDVSRSPKQGRQSGYRPAAEDNLADIPVHRPERFDGAVRAGRDLVAFDMVRAHFDALLEIISSEKGAVVKTIGDAVMATFVKPDHALAAGLRMRDVMVALNRARGTEELIVKIGIHEGPCLAVMLNERQDYFGQTVNIAAGAEPVDFAGNPCHRPGDDSPAVATILQNAAITPIQEAGRIARDRRQDRGALKYRDAVVPGRSAPSRSDDTVSRLPKRNAEAKSVQIASDAARRHIAVTECHFYRDADARRTSPIHRRHCFSKRG